VNYDYLNGDIFLSNFQRAFTPAAADFDEDGDVDGEDLADWRAGFGAFGAATYMQGDADDDNDVDGNDFLVWQRQLGSSQPPGAQSVPEPATWALFAAALAPWATGYRRRSPGASS